MQINRRSISALAVTAALTLGSGGVAQARHGSDDPAGHDARGGHHDKRAHHRHRGGRDDGPNHK